MPKKDIQRRKLILWFSEVGIDDIAIVGGKNSSLGEMYSNLSRKGIRVPNGFAITTEAYFYLLKDADIQSKIEEIICESPTPLHMVGLALNQALQILDCLPQCRNCGSGLAAIQSMLSYNTECVGESSQSVWVAGI